MKVLNEEGARDWLATRGLPYDYYSKTVRPKWRSEVGVDIEISLASAPIPMIRSILGLFWVAPWDDYATPPTEALVQFSDWDINDDPLYLRMVRLIRSAACSDPPDLLTAAAQSFGPDEGWERAAFFMVGVLADWDTYLIPDHGNFFLFTHRIGELHVICESEKTVAEQLELLTSRNVTFYVRKLGTRYLLDKYWRRPLL